MGAWEGLGALTPSTGLSSEESGSEERHQCFQKRGCMRLREERHGPWGL